MAKEYRVDRETVKLSEVDGDLNVERGSVDASEGGLVVKGVIRCNGDCEFTGDVEAQSIVSRKGDVQIAGSVKAESIDIKNGSLRVKDSI